jgi:hypothetical protein
LEIDLDNRKTHEDIRYIFPCERKKVNGHIVLQKVCTDNQKDCVTIICGRFGHIIQPILNDLSESVTHPRLLVAITYNPDLLFPFDYELVKMEIIDKEHNETVIGK